jgi:hypothetical protein
MRDLTESSHIQEVNVTWPLSPTRADVNTM